MSDVYNKVFRDVTIVSTSLGTSNEVKANVDGLDGEKDTSVLLGTLGIIANPKPQDVTGAAVGIAAVREDALTPIATMDRRLAQARGAIPTGTITLPGYEGQHVTVQEGALPGLPKVTIVAGGASITIETGVAGPTITIARLAPIPSSITLNSLGQIALTGTALLFNGVPMQIP
jgi:hypothetical protein